MGLSRTPTFRIREEMKSLTSILQRDLDAPVQDVIVCIRFQKKKLKKRGNPRP
jgi:hypothetical protein